MARRNDITQYFTASQRIAPTQPDGALPSGAPHDDGNPITGRRLADQPFHKRLALVADGHFFGKRRGDMGIFDIQLATLQRMVIHDLQHQLVAVVKKMHNGKDTEEGDMNATKKLLEDYTTAVHNYDFMLNKKAAARATGRPDIFRISSEEPLGFILMDRAGLVPRDHVRRLEDNVKWPTNENHKGKFNILPGDSRGQLLDHKDLEAFYERASMGLLGGLALIAPMLIMVLQNDLLTTLLVTSVSTVIFAGVLALFCRELKGETVLASVAAYAAVLVVFIGASS